ncbi:hypothetical protein HDU80_003018 [Chytriomyces hyalinus]|nr:hypothetical protein HDU80_003018 [Chytriomyces hyalinus]
MPSLIKSVNAAVHKLHLKSAKSTPDIDDASAFDPVWAKLEWDQWYAKHYAGKDALPSSRPASSERIEHSSEDSS